MTSISLVLVSEACTVLKICFLQSLTTERMVERTGNFVVEITGIAEERESSSAQIRTLFNGQRRTIIAECCEKVSHHELHSARAEQ